MKKKTKQRYSKVIDFRDHKVGLYDLETFHKDWDNTQTNKGEIPKGISEGRGRIVKIDDKKVLQLTIPKDSLSDGGFFWRLKLPSGLTDVTFEYDIRFGKDFDFVRGGKLPGLSGGNSPGCKNRDDPGFSARLMWRHVNTEEEISLQKAAKAEIAKIFDSKESDEARKLRFDKLRNEIKKIAWLAQDLIKDPHKAYLVQYMYYPDSETRRFGDDQIYKHKNKKIFVESNKWFNIKMRIKLDKNPRKKDTLLALVNGKEALNIKLNLRKNKDYEINEVMFSLFFGGGDPTWATKKDEKVYFRRFVISGK